MNKLDLTNKPFIITLCGSVKFRHQFEEAAKSESLSGKIVIYPSFFSTEGLTEDEEIFLSNLHKRKIDISDEVLVINPKGYIGEHTANQINYAMRKGLPVRYLKPPEKEGE